MEEFKIGDIVSHSKANYARATTKYIVRVTDPHTAEDDFAGVIISTTNPDDEVGVQEHKSSLKNYDLALLLYKLYLDEAIRL